MVLPAAAAAVVGDDGIGDGMQCSEHPEYYMNQRGNPGGICPLCLQEKLGRLVSSSPCNNHGHNSFSSSSHRPLYPSALAAPPYSSDSPSSPPSSLRPRAVGEAAGAYCSRAGGGARGTNYSSSSYAGAGTAGHRRASLSNRQVSDGGRSRMIPFLTSSHGKKKKAFFGSGSSSTSTTTTRTSSGGKVMSSTTSSSTLSAISTTASSSSGSSVGNPVFKRSKSVAPRPTGGYPADGCRPAGAAITEDPAEKFDSPRKKSFWSFLYLSSSQQSNHSSSPRSTTAAPKRRAAVGGGGGKDANASADVATAPYIRDIKLLPQPPQLPAISTGPPTSIPPSRGGNNRSHEDAKTPRRDQYPQAVAPATATAIAVARAEEAVDESPGSGSQASSSFGRKVGRSRSVGCGSRSFSGDFLERISTVGFGDCALRRVESQREAKPGKAASHHRRPAPGEEDHEIPPPQRVVRCGGIFGGFYSSSSSSSYWLSDDLGSENGGRISTAALPAGDGSGDTGTPHSRRSWAWAAFASPMRAFRQSASFNKHASAVSAVNGATQATGVSTSSSATVMSRATAAAGAAAGAVLAVKG